MAIVLLIDPSRTIRRVVEMAFKASGHDIVAADSAAAGKEAVVRYDPAVVLLNYRLPDAPGLELLGALRADPATSGVPIVVLGGTYEAFDADRARQTGASSVLLKPFKTEALRQTVDGLISGAGVPATAQPAVSQPAGVPQAPPPPPPAPQGMRPPAPMAVPPAPMAAPRAPMAPPPAAPRMVPPPAPPVRQAPPVAPPQAALPAPPVPRAAPVAPAAPVPASPPVPSGRPVQAPAAMVTADPEAVRAAVREFLPQVVRDALAQLLRDGLENRLRSYAQERVAAMFQENLRETARQLVEQEIQRYRGG